MDQSCRMQYAELPRGARSCHKEYAFLLVMHSNHMILLSILLMEQGKVYGTSKTTGRGGHHTR